MVATATSVLILLNVEMSGLGVLWRANSRVSRHWADAIRSNNYHPPLGLIPTTNARTRAGPGEGARDIWQLAPIAEAERIIYSDVNFIVLVNLCAGLAANRSIRFAAKTFSAARNERPRIQARCRIGERLWAD